MKPIGQFITRIADLIEAEGRALRASSVSVGLAIALALAAALLAVGGLGLIAWGVFEALRSAAGLIGAALVSGVLLLACAGVLVWIVTRLGKGR